jgi:hypothetical protein
MRIRAIAAALTVLSAGIAAQGQQFVVPVPTEKEIRTQVDAGEYRDALKGLGRALDLKGKPAEGMDRVALLMLRAECQLQLKETQATLASLEQARKEAAAGGRGDDVGTALAMTALIQKSVAFKYTPKTSNGPLTPKPMDILNRQTRQEVFKALFADQLLPTRAKVKQAEQSRTMPPVLEAAKLTSALRAIEKAANNETTESEEMAKTLGQHAVDMLTNSVGDLSGQVDAIFKYANTVVTVPMARYDQTSGKSWIEQVSRRHGIDGNQPQQLKQIQTTCGQVETAANEMSLLLPASGEAFKNVATSATALKTRAGEVLNEDYTRK